MISNLCKTRSGPHAIGEFNRNNLIMRRDLSCFKLLSKESVNLSCKYSILTILKIILMFLPFKILPSQGNEKLRENHQNSRKILLLKVPEIKNYLIGL